MGPVSAGKYEYSPESLARVRQQLKLTQAKMAKLLGVPANTLSRWETGATTPDAESLAAIYSAAMEQGITPSFFQRRKAVPATQRRRTHPRLIVMWDAQNVSFPTNQMKYLDTLFRAEMARRFGTSPDDLFKVFAHATQSNVLDELEQLNWVAFEHQGNVDDELIHHAKSDCGQAPKATNFVLIANNEGYVNLVADLKKRGTQVYLLTSRYGYSQRLVNEVGIQRWKQLPDAWTLIFQSHYPPARLTPHL